ncbi:uncharacterized protein LOC6041942 isoform X2 [Culex quinquefasciatus]|uniref:uncharacterized protein LOC6041942 isoform X2 n=1 Tax=Culex quinquefasciatus TaxID=7176 RepID=UPI0018E31FB8|nr:uncharacterized protein LOC6041942 isoform X2 [Culex quinquefasciatus]
MDPVVGEDTAAGNTLSADELESWTLLDSSPRRSPNPVQTMDSKRKDHPSRVEDEEEEEDVSEAESASEEEEAAANEADQEQEEKVEEVVSVKEKTSRVEVVQEKGPAARDTRQDEAVQKKKKKHRKKRTDSEPSVESQDDDGCSSDGISVISESDGSETRVARARDQRKVHLAKGIRLEPVVTPLDLKEQQQLSRDDASKQLVREDAIVPWGGVNRTSVVVLGMVVTAIVAVLVGNSRLHTNRVDEFSFQHEQRISELELENNILKNEMNKLKHLYTRSELDEQVQQADTEWAKVLDEKLAEEQERAQPEPEPEPEPESPAGEPLKFRKVPPQDEDVKHNVVWSGDDGQPMLIADKDYVLPDFCFNKDAVQDDLFSEYSGKYCDIKKRKIEAKQRKAEFARKNHKRYRDEPKDYSKYIIPTKEEIDEYQRQATATPPKPPSLSPFDFDYQKAFETIKEEGAVIVDSLVAILDLDPEPEYLPTPSPSASSLESASYQADDEASPSPTPSTDSVPSGIRWESFPPWVREKYESQPEMHAKLRHKESLLWDWERKKNEFLHQVGLETLEEVGRKSEDELRQRRDEYKSKGRQQGQSGEWRKEEHQYKERKHDGRKEEFREKKYDERKGGKERYEERKEWNDRSRGSGENRSRDYKEQHHDKDHQQQPRKNDSDKHQRKPEHHGESSKEWKNNEYRNDRSREASGSGKPYNNNKKEERKDSSREDKKNSEERDHKKDWKETGSGEQRKNHSGERRDGKPHHKKQWKEASGEHSGEHGKRKNDHGDDKRGGAKRNGDQWNWSKDHGGEDHSGEGSYLSQYRGEDHHKKKEQEGWKHEGKRNYRDDDDDDDDGDDHHKKHYGGKEDYQRKHHHKDDDHWKRKKHHDGDRKWQEHSQERRR